jgi:uncharacterized protein YecT (DUF1311 family)
MLLTLGCFGRNAAPACPLTDCRCKAGLESEKRRGMRGNIFDDEWVVLSSYNASMHEVQQVSPQKEKPIAGWVTWLTVRSGAWLEPRDTCSVRRDRNRHEVGGIYQNLRAYNCLLAMTARRQEKA